MTGLSTQGWSLSELLRKGQRFKPAPRVSYKSPNLQRQIQQHESDGVPLVIEDWQHHPRWPKDLFDIDHCRKWFREHDKDISARNVHTRQDKIVSFESFLESSRNMPTFIEPGETERWYGKDIECPQPWEDWLRNGRVLPENLIPEGSDDFLRFRPKKDGRSDIETLMCYFGIGDTYTPCHKDLCASSGQNLMCFTEKNGSSYWIMTKSSDAAKVTNFFYSLNHVLDHERHVISFKELTKAPFDVYVLEQQLGDLVLVPPRSCHQVTNSGGLTLKMSWSRMKLQGLATALYFELPLYRRVCRAEIYQVKGTIYYALLGLTKELQSFSTQKRRLSSDSTERAKSLSEQLRALLPLYDRVLLEENCPFSDDVNIKQRGPKTRRQSAPLDPDSESALDDFCTCDFCGADIFQSYFQCFNGVDKSDKTVDDEDIDGSYIVCSGCYVEGRTCSCKHMKPMQRQSFEPLFTAHWDAVQALKNNGVLLDSDEVFSSFKHLKSFFSRRTECSIFRAAMLLHRVRQQQKVHNIVEKSCRTSSKHVLPAIGAVTCKKCHGAKCFPHILEKHKMHSIQVLLEQEQDETHEIYHKVHKGQPSAYQKGSPIFLQAQDDGTDAPDIYIQLAYNTSRFNSCEPLSPTCASFGWYDLSSDTALGASDSEQPRRKKGLRSKKKIGDTNIKSQKAQAKVAKDQQPKLLSDEESDLTTLPASDLESIAWLTEEDTPSIARGKEKESVINDSNARSSIGSDKPLSIIISRKRPVSGFGREPTSSKSAAVRPPKRPRRSTTLESKNEVVDDAANGFSASLSSALNQIHKPPRKPEVVIPKRNRNDTRKITDVSHASSPHSSIPLVSDASMSNPRAKKDAQTQTEGSTSTSRLLDRSFSSQENESRRVVLDDTQMERIINSTAERVIERLGRNTLLSTLPPGGNTPSHTISNPFAQLTLDLLTTNTSNAIPPSSLPITRAGHIFRQDPTRNGEISLQVHREEEEQKDARIASANHKETLKSKGKRKQGDEPFHLRSNFKKRNIRHDEQNATQVKSNPRRAARPKSASIKPTRKAGRQSKKATASSNQGRSFSSNSDYDEDLHGKEFDSDGPV